MQTTKPLSVKEYKEQEQLRESAKQANRDCQFSNMAKKINEKLLNSHFGKDGVVVFEGLTLPEYLIDRIKESYENEGWNVEIGYFPAMGCGGMDSHEIRMSLKSDS